MYANTALHKVVGGHEVEQTSRWCGCEEVMTEKQPAELEAVAGCVVGCEQEAGRQAGRTGQYGIAPCSRFRPLTWRRLPHCPWVDADGVPPLLGLAARVPLEAGEGEERAAVAGAHPQLACRAVAGHHLLVQVDHSSDVVAGDWQLQDARGREQQAACLSEGLDTGGTRTVPAAHGRDRGAYSGAQTRQQSIPVCLSAPQALLLCFTQGWCASNWPQANTRRHTR